MKDLTTFYEEIQPEYYEQLRSKRTNFVRRWFHNSRYTIIQNFVESLYKEGSVVVEMGCGSCEWNTNNIPVVGIDVNKKMLDYAKKRNKLTKTIVTNANETTLPSNYADIVILCEVLEHLEDPEITVKEAVRILKKDGVLLVSVPYDTPFSLWFPLFNMECIVLGYIFNKPFYKKFGGHIQHFSPRSIKKVLEKADLQIGKQFHFHRLTIYNICSKKER